MSRTYNTDPKYVKELRAAKEGRIRGDDQLWKTYLRDKAEAGSQSWVKNPYIPVAQLNGNGAHISKDNVAKVSKAIQEACEDGRDFRFVVILRYEIQGNGPRSVQSSLNSLFSNFVKVSNRLLPRNCSTVVSKKEGRFFSGSASKVISVTIPSDLLVVSGVSTLRLVKNAAAMVNSEVHPENNVRISNLVEVFLEFFQEEPLPVNMNLLQSQYDPDSRNVNLKREGSFVHVVDSRDGLPVNGKISVPKAGNKYKCTCRYCVGPDKNSSRGNTHRVREDLTRQKKAYNCGGLTEREY